MTTGRHPNNYPKLHNATWPGLVGKGSPGAEPAIDLDTMIRLTVEAESDGVRFDGIDLFLYDPHFSIDASDGDIRELADRVRSLGLSIGSVVAPVWPGTGGGEAIGSEEDRARFLGQVRKACSIARRFRELGVRPYGIVRIDSASSVDGWSRDPAGNQEKIAGTFRDACEIAGEYGERLAAEGEICWGGMHSWKRMVQLLQMVNQPGRLGLQADMAHTLLYLQGFNAPEDAILRPDFDWEDSRAFDEAYAKLTSILRPWTLDFHVAQNDATVFGSGDHDRTGRHCRPSDPGGKLDIVRHAGYWLRDEAGTVTRRIRHLCWDGCMFPNAVMMQPQTWNEILEVMVRVRDAHGWKE
jgi:sugar phosphate isomerase/epimerase